MKFLKENGYQTMDLAGALIGLEANKQEYKQVVVTFDDAYRDFYTDASPILAKYGFSATVFVVTGLTGSGRARTGALEYMTWSEVREVYSHGIRIGSHTVSHPELQALSSEQVDAEVRKSKEVLENELGASVQSFSYPYAFPEQDQHFIHLLKTRLRNCGYENGVSTMIGTATSENDPFFLPRLPINCYDDLRFFRAKLEGAYDWLHAPQKFYKSFCKMGSSPTRELLHANQN
jgi:peptidoglycan/xylan/chitin deacetylase (PgdA/CDA1 family)